MKERDRQPLLDDAGRERLEALRQHRHAPKFNYRAGERLDAAALQRVRAFASSLAKAPFSMPREARNAFAGRAVRDVPIYRRLAVGWHPEDGFEALPTVSRAELAHEPWSFVPDAVELTDLITYPTSGTTGHPLLIPSHPEAVAKYLPLMGRALARHGVALEGGVARLVGVALLGWQKRTYTFVSAFAQLEHAAFVKLNLEPDDWRNPQDRRLFLQSIDAELLTGDPLAFSELLRLAPKIAPKALLSTAMSLSPALRDQLAAQFACPVVDVYSMNEAGPIAFATPAGFVPLAPDLTVELLHPDGKACAAGERGEVTLTGGRNPFLPLLRYRTGDYAARGVDANGKLVLEGLEGREPVVFRGAEGRVVNNIDVTWALREFALAQFTLLQRKDGSLRLRGRGVEPARDAIDAKLGELFGEVPRQIEAMRDDEREAKPKQYVCEIV